MKILSLSLIVVLAMSTAVFAAGPLADRGEPNYEPIAVGPSASPDDITGVLFAEEFTLSEPYVYTWRADEPEITSGWVLVVGVSSELAEQRAIWNPVLYVGRYPAEITAFDAQEGRLVVIVPGDVDLANDPIYFGSVELPGMVTPERAEQEMQAALAAGFEPISSETLRMIESAGLGAVNLRSGYELYAGPVADAIDSFAPAASGIAQSYRAPLVARP